MLFPPPIFIIFSSSFVWILVNGDRCVSNETIVPASFKMEHAENYRFLESALQIYTELRIPCDGYLTEWRFLAGNPFIYALHLGVFRKRSSKPALIFELVAESHLSAMSTPDGVSGIWVYYPPAEPISVKMGDLIGVFYDKYAISMEMLTIVNKNEINIGKFDRAKTYVMLLDNLTLRKNRTVDATKAGVAYRKPALSALVTPHHRLLNNNVPPPSSSPPPQLDVTPRGVEIESTTTTTTMPPSPSPPSESSSSRKLSQSPSTVDEIVCNGLLCWPSVDYL